MHHQEMPPQNDKAKEIGKRIRALRARAEMSQEELARAAGDGVLVTKDQISTYERGKYAPAIERAEALAKALGVSVDALLGTDPELRANDPHLEDFLALPEASSLRPEVIARLRAIRFSEPQSVAMWRVIANQYVVEFSALPPAPVRVRKGHRKLPDDWGKK